MYCLSFYIYHLSAQQLLSCDLSVLPSPQPSYRHNWNHWNFFGAYWKGLGWIVFSDKKGLAKKIKENWIKFKFLKKKFLLCYPFLLNFFPFFFFALQNPCFLILHIMLPFIVSSKNVHPYFISLALPNRSLFWRHHILTSPDLRGMTKVYGEHSYFSVLLPSCERASFPCFGVLQACLPVTLSSEDHCRWSHLQDRKWEWRIGY